MTKTVVKLAVITFVLLSTLFPRGTRLEDTVSDISILLVLSLAYFSSRSLRRDHSPLIGYGLALFFLNTLCALLVSGVDKLLMAGLESILLYYFAFHLGRICLSQCSIEFTVGTIVVGGAINALISLYYWAVETGMTFGRYNTLPVIEGSQGVHAVLMSTAALLGLALIALRKRQAYRVMLPALLLPAVCIASLATTAVRQVWIVFLLQLLILAFTVPHARKKLLPVFALLSVAGIVLTLGNDELLSSVYELIDRGDSVGGRSDLGQVCLGVWEKSPLMGIGYGMFPRLDIGYIYVDGIPTEVSSAHNGVMGMLVEGGVIGLAIMTGISCVVLRRAWRVIREDPHVLMHAIALLAIATILQQVVSNSLLFPPVVERNSVHLGVFFWFVTGLCFYSRPVDEHRSR